RPAGHAAPAEGRSGPQGHGPGAVRVRERGIQRPAGVPCRRRGDRRGHGRGALPQRGRDRDTERAGALQGRRIPACVAASAGRGGHGLRPGGRGLAALSRASQAWPGRPGYAAWFWWPALLPGSAGWRGLAWPLRAATRLVGVLVVGFDTATPAVSVALHDG